MFPLAYAENLKNDYPNIWAKGGNIQGNDTYRVITRIRNEGKSAEELTANDIDIVRMREAWSARHFKDFRLAGVVAQIKWHMIGSRGLDHMKLVIEEAKNNQKKSVDKNIDEIKAYWKKIDDQREKLVVKTQKEIKLFFDEQNKKIQKRLKNATESNVKNIVNELIDSTDKEIRNVLIAMNRVAIDEFGTQTYNDHHNQKMMNKKFTPYNDALLYWITKHIANAVTYVQDSTKLEIKNIITNAVNQGWGIGNEKTPNTIAFAIGKLYLDQIIPNRSETIARTEVMSASNKGSLEGAQQSGADLLKFWIPTYDGDTRDSHLETGNHKAIPLDELFSVGSSKGEFPADPNLPAKERINCRCATGYKRSKSE